MKLGNLKDKEKYQIPKHTKLNQGTLFLFNILRKVIIPNLKLHNGVMGIKQHSTGTKTDIQIDGAE